MISEPSVKRALFFFSFGLLNDGLAKSAAAKTVRLCGRLKKNVDGESVVDFVRISHSIWRKIQKKKELITLESEICHIPSSVQLSSWRDFKRSSSEEEFLTVLWTKVLEIPQEKVAEGLGVTVGTVRYRLSCGLKKLGAACEVPGA